ncbi:hypothetical protein [Marivivens aquimaris]|uniref:hypothetical protein n=1 Tax=Marivivens aquimaris TaxID=2774876 RepID=UPI00187F436A|nr:hypothetical protein [Marivivens aquimaris]
MLTAPRQTAEAIGPTRVGLLAAAASIFAGAMIARNAAGHLTKGQTATGLVGAGVAYQTVDNSDGAAGAASVEYRVNTAILDNSTGADELTAADIGKACWIVDDHTVARTSASSTRSRAGIVSDILAEGVAVEFNEALTRAADPAAA